MKKQIDLILNGKGGVGKSFFATNFVQYLKDHQIEHVAIDTDNENSTLKRFHSDARFVNIGQSQQIDELFATLEKTPLVVVDCRAASTDIFLNYFAELKVFDLLESMGASLTVISPVNHDLDSVEQIRILEQAFHDHCTYAIVRNHAHSEHFSIYDSSKTRARLLGELQAKEMTMPRLYDWLVAKLNQVNLPIGQALQHSSFSLMDRQRLKNWQRQFYEQIGLVRDILLPDEDIPESKPKTTKGNTTLRGS
jgi:hypothetical protein